MSKYREGFLLGLAEMGVTPDDLDLYVKQANIGNSNGIEPIFDVTPLASGAKDTIGTGLGGALKYLVDLPLAASIPAGLLAGYGLAKGVGALAGVGNSAEEDKIKELKNQELINEMQYHIDKKKLNATHPWNQA